MGFLRDNTCRIGQYLPDFVQHDAEMGAALSVESQEHDRQRIMLLDMLDQFFVDSATWGLADWESVLAIAPTAGDTFQQRRQRILLKLQGKQTSTVEFLRKLCMKYMSDDSVVEIAEHTSEYYFNVVSRKGSILYFPDMLDALDTYKPAHLAYGIQLDREIHIDGGNAIRYALINATIGKKRIGIAAVPNMQLTGYAGVGYARAGKISIGIAAVPSMKATPKAAIYNIKTGRIRIGGYR